MPDSGWSVRLFEANDYSDEATIDFLSNYKKGKSRQLDSIITYSGMYGIDNYLVWNLHKDLPSYDFSTVALDLSLFMYKSTDIVYFQDFYRVQDIKFNPSKSQYTLYAVSETTVRLHSKLIKYGVTSLSYEKDRTAKQLLKEIIQKNNIFYVVFHHDGASTADMIDYQYRYFAIDPEWTVLDLIEYIADDNQYEWCVTTFVDKGTNKPYFFLHIGHEIKASEHMNATKPYNIETDNISDSVYTMKITTDGSPMQPLAHWEGDYKCLWSKHTAGKGGGISRGCFAPMGMGHFDKSLYLRTLEGNIERDIGYSMLNRRKVKSPSIGIGNILKDEGVLKDDEGKSIGVSPYIDEVSVQKNPKTYTIREPHNIIINRGDNILVQHQLEKISRSTPYLDYEAGLLFPSPKFRDEVDGTPIPQENPPNSIIFNVDGKKESAVLGPFVMGKGGGDYPIPKKNRDDFRLRFPDKSEIYYNAESKRWHLFALGGIAIKDNVVEYDELPHYALTQDDVAKEKIRMVLHDGGFQIEGKIPLFILEPGGCFRIDPYFNDTGDGPSRYSVRGWNDAGQLDFYADNKINIKISEANGVIDIEIGPDGTYAGTININTAGTVNIGANATAVNIAGGAKALSRETHTHTTPVAIPGPPQTSTPTTDNTIITKAD